MRSLFVAVYRLFLLFYPTEFRRACGLEMVETFSSRVDEVLRRRKLSALVQLAVRTSHDVLITGLAEWRDVLRHRSEHAISSGSSGPRATLMHVSREVHHAFRMIRKRPGMSLIAVVTLTFGIMLTTTMYAIASGFAAPLPFHDARAIKHVGTTARLNPGQRSLVSVREFLAWQERQVSFDEIAAYRAAPANVGRAGAPARNVEVTAITPGAFEMLGVAPAIGRTLRPDDRLLERVTVLSYGLWSREFNADSGAIGQTLRIRGEPHTIIGVMPDGFVFPVQTSAWTLLSTDIAADLDVTSERSWGLGINVFGRIRPAIRTASAEQELQRISSNIFGTNSDAASATDVLIQPFTDWYIDDAADVLMYLMLFATVAVLIIACFNVANLLLARTIVRSRELAVRSALGASRRSIVLALLCESSVLSVVGALFGVILAAIAVEGVDRAVSLAQLPFWVAFGLDLNVLLFVAAITTVSGIVAGMLPAVQATRSDISSVLQDQARGSTGFRIGRVSNMLVVSEVILSCGLLLAGGFIARNMIRVATTDIKYETENILTARLELTNGVYDDRDKRTALIRSLEQRLNGHASVAAATMSTQLPAMGRAYGRVRTEKDGAAEFSGLPRTRDVSISEGFLETFRLEVLQGETFRSYQPGTDAVLINETFAAEAFPSQNPVGQRLQVLYDEPNGRWMTVVGVLPDLFIPGAPVEQEGEWCLYRPLIGSSHVVVSVRGAVAGAPLLEILRGEVAALDSDLAVSDVSTMQFMASRHLLFYAAFGAAFVVSGGVSLFLAIVGLYAVISFSVSRRTHEVGIRMALGAPSSRVVTLIMKQAMVRLVIGLVCGTALGVVLASGLAAVMTSMSPSSMSESNPVDPIAFATVLAMMGLTSIAACIVPALRASRVDPVVAFRSE